ncbi:MAG: hypothetical protein KAS05_00120 [Candidatus Omnitrophica bacterium]|nr:hypothetical protein [Candidatus Omnitrophota bacterium]
MNIIIPILSALFGLIFGHWLNRRRNFENKKREIRINYLIEAYRKLERGAIPNAKNFDKGDFESAIADIQMLGNLEQVNIAYEFAIKATQGDGSKLQELLENLRMELRNELSIKNNKLPKISPFRIN